MELMFWWVVPLGAAGAGLAAWTALHPARNANARRRPAAHVDRLTSLPEYQAALRRHRRWLVVAAAACGALLASTLLAAGRPVAVDTIRPEQHNRDIVLCLDASGSMSSADAEVVEVFARLADEFKGERIGLTVFDSTAVQVFPLTDDYEYAREQLTLARDAFNGKPGSSGFLDGTWSGRGSSLIGDGLASCITSFPSGTDQAGSNEAGGGRESGPPRRSRSVVLATDNFVSGDPIMSLAEAARMAKERNVHVYALNPGDFDYGTDENQPGAQLRSAAELSGGAYYALDSPEAVPGIVRAVQDTEASALQGAPRAVVTEGPDLPLAAALLSGLVLGVASWRLRP
ncbi:von Willebrand factor type A domain protein [Pseudarthrobacter siccitolerans]|uniref:von Willebrand factor type A domain protein n=1 Tax=Pseudarthrobacter siccitolerans TaxID=861266 RepID=A0A024H2A2_9MICC|nr:von Willebrand factor type A domain protein [Pseudarthrobacter siccitolerans]